MVQVVVSLLLNFLEKGGKSEKVWDIDSGFNDHNAGLVRMQQEEHQTQPAFQLIFNFQHQSVCGPIGSDSWSRYQYHSPGGYHSQFEADSFKCHTTESEQPESGDRNSEYPV